MSYKIGIAFLCGVALLAGCTDNQEYIESQVSEAGGPPVIDTTTLRYFQQDVGDSIFFQTDSSRLTDVAQRTLTRQAAWLLENPGVSAVIEGHTDERGTREYNLALGARRAEEARTFLIGQGVDAGRLSTISYGKERPAALCSAESCWAENRRAVTILAGAPLS